MDNESLNFDKTDQDRPVPQSTTASLMSAEEWMVYDYLSAAYNKFVELEVLFVTDQQDFSNGINVLKNILMSRPVERELARRKFGGYIAKEGWYPVNEDEPKNT